ncbi:MauE/DoxX family redox-associated membrane protein [Paenactinomyces guangxiensis]|uniref:DoxX family membrane protein n=1 Tax=Paenactinomyces guangxiensis TaxID=1490290 RepID=A0A7W1WUZ6_9BACL|nr:MauE/DoxX family redox-associated membrane protein [Paenactinomyces guangxiensis]MBA4496468.1 DoxX family membrane protein [Paenactinomyces guangxiensis]MBH8593584.1 DoxX family membrane protein [Paenactinomyces guangxiensis]
MEYISLFMRTILFCLFLSTSLHKLKDFSHHVQTLTNYNLLERRLVVPLAILGVIQEIAITICMLFGLFIEWVSLISIALLVIYTLAISVSLIRGQSNLNCGCGGIAGNHKISWWLVFRNILWTIPCTWLAVNQQRLFRLDDYFISGSFYYDISSLFAVFSGLVFSLIIGILNELKHLNTMNAR